MSWLAPVTPTKYRQGFKFVEYSPCTRAQHEWGHGIGWNLEVLGRWRACSYLRVFLPHLDGFCHLSQDILTQSIPSPANPWRQALQKQKNVFYSKPLFELFWENYSWDGQLGFASGYRRILTAIYNSSDVTSGGTPIAI